MDDGLRLCIEVGAEIAAPDAKRFGDACFVSFIQVVGEFIGAEPIYGQDFFRVGGCSRIAHLYGATEKEYVIKMVAGLGAT